MNQLRLAEALRCLLAGLDLGQFSFADSILMYEQELSAAQQTVLQTTGQSEKPASQQAFQQSDKKEDSLREAFAAQDFACVLPRALIQIHRQRKEGKGSLIGLVQADLESESELAQMLAEGIRFSLRLSVVASGFPEQALELVDEMLDAAELIELASDIEAQELLEALYTSSGHDLSLEQPLRMALCQDQGKVLWKELPQSLVLAACKTYTQSRRKLATYEQSPSRWKTDSADLSQDYIEAWEADFSKHWTQT